MQYQIKDLYSAILNLYSRGTTEYRKRFDFDEAKG